MGSSRPTCYLTCLPPTLPTYRDSGPWAPSSTLLVCFPGECCFSLYSTPPALPMAGVYPSADSLPPLLKCHLSSAAFTNHPAENGSTASPAGLIPQSCFALNPSCLCHLNGEPVFSTPIVCFFVCLLREKASSQKAGTIINLNHSIFTLNLREGWDREWAPETRSQQETCAFVSGPSRSECSPGQSSLH